MKQIIWIRNKIKKLFTPLLVVALFLCESSGVGALWPVVFARSQTEEFTIQNPIITNDDSLSAGQCVKYQCLWFGSYPQEEVGRDSNLFTDLSALPDEKWDDRNDYVYQGVKYRRMKAADAVYYTTGKSSYYDWAHTKEYHYFIYQPIKWRVLQMQGEEALLLADTSLDDFIFDLRGIMATTWKDSTIRSWLNGYGPSENAYHVNYAEQNWINQAFTLQEKKAILTRTVVNSEVNSQGCSGGEDTMDPVFFLSQSEMTNPEYGFLATPDVADEARYSRYTEYASARGVCMATEGADHLDACSNWLRSPGQSREYYHYTDYSGAINQVGIFVSAYDEGIRPALRLNLSDISAYQDAGWVYSNGEQEEKSYDTIWREPVLEQDASSPTKTRVTYHCLWYGSCPSHQITQEEYPGLYQRLTDNSRTVWTDQETVIDEASLDVKKYYREQQDTGGYIYYAVEPVKWRILSKDQGGCLLIADQILDALPYHQTDTSVSWSVSDLRAIMNSKSWTDRFFSAKEQEALLQNETGEKVSLLSTSDMNQEEYGFSVLETEDPAKVRMGTEYALQRGLWTSQSTGNAGWWWIRSASTSAFATAVNPKGVTEVGKEPVIQATDGVVPVIQLSWQTIDDTMYAGTVSTNGDLYETGSVKVLDLPKQTTPTSIPTQIQTAEPTLTPIPALTPTLTPTSEKETSDLVSSLQELGVPPDMQVKEKTNLSVTISWKRMIDAFGYAIYRKTGTAKNWTYLYTAGMDVTSYQDFEVIPGKKYSYRMRAFYREGEHQSVSSYSTKQTIVYQGAPRLPRITMRHKGNQMTILVWANASVDGVVIEKRQGKKGKYRVIKNDFGRRHAQYALIVGKKSKWVLSVGSEKSYYRMRGYRIYQGKMIFSKYTHVIRA